MLTRPIQGATRPRLYKMPNNRLWILFPSGRIYTSGAILLHVYADARQLQGQGHGFMRDLIPCEHCKISYHFPLISARGALLIEAFVEGWKSRKTSALS